MIILIQVGNLGSSVIDHLFTPLAQSQNVEKVVLFCHRLGPAIPSVEYCCPPKLFSKFVIISLIWESIDLFFKSLFTRKAYISGYLLFPHSLLAFIIAKLTKKMVIIGLIAGPVELFGRGSPLGINFTKDIPLYGKVLLNMLKHSNAIITTGSVTKTFLVNHEVEPEKIYPMINPPNKTRFFPQQILKFYDVIAVGALSPVKHHEVFLYTLSKVKIKYPCIKACLVGDGPRREELIKLADKLGITANVDFVGYQQDVPHFLNCSKIFVHTSEREGFPNVVLEAMMCGLPCVVSNCGDITDLARDGHNSLVIPRYNDYKAFAKAIINLLEDEAFRSKLEKNAVKTVQLISTDKIAHEWEMILDKINQHG